MSHTAGARRRPSATAALGAALAAVALALALLIGSALAAPATAAVPPARVAASDSVAPSGSEAPSASVAPSASMSDSRVGGSPPGPERGKPGWVWFGAAALVVVLGAGGFRLWRNRELDEPELDTDLDGNPDLDPARGPSHRAPDDFDD